MEDGSQPATGPVSVMVVDDQEPFRRAARVVLENTDGFELVGEANSGEEAILMVEDLEPQLILMDINMPGIDGIAATRRIKEIIPDTTVMFVSTYTLEDLPPHARSSGATALVNKEDLAPRLLRRLWDERHEDHWAPA